LYDEKKKINYVYATISAIISGIDVFDAIGGPCFLCDA
jgi:hypothetical protein